MNDIRRKTQAPQKVQGLEEEKVPESELNQFSQKIVISTRDNPASSICVNVEQVDAEPPRESRIDENYEKIAAKTTHILNKNANLSSLNLLKNKERELGIDSESGNLLREYSEGSLKLS